jgi:CheY-like chemotaxis protein
VSRISRGNIELRKGRVDLATAVLQAVEAARPFCELMEHELTVTLPPQPVYLDADPTRLAQVIGNLLNNACKFTDKGGRIALVVARDGDTAAVRVSDSGVGLAADQLPRIFDMFTQIDTSLERSRGGLGIGLTLVKSLVEMHGGTVLASSAGLNQGSEFVVRLPVLADVADQRLPEPVPREPAQRRRILVVDDNRDAATSLSDLLELTGHDMRVAHDGLEAVSTAEKFRPDVVLLDIGLPKLNGYEVARKIRQEGWGERVTLVALTGWGQDEDRRKSSEAGFNAHMVKPVDPVVLMDLLDGLRSSSP